jgi:hypothetical protein
VAKITESDGRWLPPAMVGRTSVLGSSLQFKQMPQLAIPVGFVLNEVRACSLRTGSATPFSFSLGVI